jgi:hypothetical protein
VPDEKYEKILLYLKVDIKMNLKAMLEGIMMKEAVLMRETLKAIGIKQ